MSEWKYDPLYPAAEWSEEADAIWEERQLVLEGRVYLYLCRRARADGYVRLDIQEGFDWIARAAVDVETALLFSMEQQFTNTDDETWVLFKIREDVELALENLHAEGKIEWVIRNGWPWMFIPNAAQDAIAGGLEDDRYIERAARITELQTMPYREYLETPEWQERRRIHLAHAGDRCQVCNRSTFLQVHHRTYEHRGNERFSGLIVLCRSCHRHFHDRMRIVRDVH